MMNDTNSTKTPPLSYRGQWLIDDLDYPRVNIARMVRDMEPQRWLCSRCKMFTKQPRSCGECNALICEQCKRFGYHKCAELVHADVGPRDNANPFLDEGDEQDEEK